MLVQASRSSGGDLAERTERYVRETLGLELRLEPWSGSETLPFYLSSGKAFEQGRLLDRKCIFVLTSEQEGVGALLKQARSIEERVDGSIVILIVPSLGAVGRRRLIEQRAAFVVPGSQFFVPQLGVRLSEAFKVGRAPQVTGFSPTAQTMVLSSLLGSPLGAMTATRLAPKLGITPMTAGRALAELEEAGILGSAAERRSAGTLFKCTGMKLWDLARDRLRSPVVKTRPIIGVAPIPGALKAGQSALAEYTDMSTPGQTCLALPSRAWSKLGVVAEPLPSRDADLLLQTWSYDPRSLSDTGIVDPLSLHLSLRGSADPRVAGAVDELLWRIGR